MKDRVRETVFNLVGPAVTGKHAIDIFVGTGVLALEALSRVAASATFIERHFHTARLISENVASLQVQDIVELVPGVSFSWGRQHPNLPDNPWIVLCSPPYEFFGNMSNSLVVLLQTLIERAPDESIFVVEAPQDFDIRQLYRAPFWDVRTYPPTTLAIYRAHHRELRRRVAPGSAEDQY
jgi:16S rRNA (guanine966-N2)-methyltransferase